jgi:hypothetical protein
MKTLIWSITALLALSWTGLVWLASSLSAWLLGVLDPGRLKDAGHTVAGLPLPPLPEWLAPWFSPAWLADWQTFGTSLLDWLGGVLPAGDTMMAWVGPVLWVGWGLGLLTLVVLAATGHWLAGRRASFHQAIRSTRA